MDEAPGGSRPFHFEGIVLLRNDQERAGMSDADVSRDTITYIPVSSIQANPHQPRRDFDQTKLEELAESIEKHGIMQNVVVSPADIDGTYTLISGERRVRAARIAGLAVVPAIVRTGDPAVLALVENLHRVDISPLEEAEGYQSLIDRGEAHESIASLVGKSRSYVTQKLRLLKLPRVVQIAMALDYYGKGVLSEGAARQLMRLALYDRAATQGASGRESILATRADAIINSPGRLRGVAEIRRAVDEQLLILWLAGTDYTDVSDAETRAKAKQICDSATRGAKNGNYAPLSQQDHALLVWEIYKPDLSRLTEKQNGALRDAAICSINYLTERA